MRPVRNFVIQFILGGLFGMTIAALLLAVAVPNFGQYHLPHSYLALLINTSPTLAQLTRFGDYSSYIAALVVALSWLLVVRYLNTHLTAFPYTKTKTPWLAWVLIILSGLLFWSGMAMALSQAERISWDYFPALRIIGGLALVAASWWLISDRGFARDFTFPVHLKKSYLPDYARCISFGGLTTIVFVAVFSIFSKLMASSFVLTEFIDRGSEPEIRSAFILTGILVLFAGSMFAILSGLVPALDAGNDSFRKRMARCKPAVVYLVLVTIALAAYVPYARSVHHFGKKNLTDVIELSKPGFSHRAVVVVGSKRSGKKPPYKAFRVLNYKDHIDVHGFMKNTGPIPVNKDNVLLLEQFLVSKGKRSIFRKGAITAIPMIHFNLWNQQGILNAYDNLLSSDATAWPPIIWSQSRLVWLAYSAPVTGSNRKLLNELSNAKKYNIQGQSALTLARAWYRFGNRGRAQQWWKHGLETIGNTGSSRVKDLDFRGLPLVTNGSISGRVITTGRKKVSIIRVGLFSVRSNKSVYSPHQQFYSFRLVKGVTPGKDGSFRFTNLGYGKYQLGFMLDGNVLTMTKSMVAIGNNPGTLAITGHRRQVNTGTIGITIKF